MLLSGGTPGKRFALPNARVLIHQPSTEGGGQGSDIEIQAREILRMRSLLEEIIAKHSGKPAAEVRKGTSNATKFSTPMRPRRMV
ncbi:hypothetical protein GCM10020219_003520 [Nonomuraea dietziae]